jgi:hypothetical protein
MFTFAGTTKFSHNHYGGSNNEDEGRRNLTSYA